MVGLFAGSTDVGTVKDQAFDYSSATYFNWLLRPSQSARIEVARQKEQGLAFQRDLDRSYFSQNFGVFANAIADVPPLKVGEYISRAANIKLSIDQFMVRDYHPDTVQADLAGIYYKLRKFAKKQGYNENFEIKAFSSGYIPDRAVAAVYPILENYAFFFKNKKYGEAIRSQAARHNVSYEASALYTMMHEFTHLFGLRHGNEVVMEATLEKLIKDFTGNLIKDIYSAPMYSEKRKIELIRILRDIKKIAKNRYGYVSELYGGGLEHKLASQHSNLEKAVRELTKEAMYKMGINTQEGIKKYVSAHLKDKMKEYSKGKEYQGREASKAKKSKKNKSKKKTKKGKKAAKK